MPSCLIRGVRSVELATTNIEEAARFYETVWMLDPVEMRGGKRGARFFRGTAGYHHLLGLHTGAQPAVVRIVFDVADRKAVDALHRAIAAAGGKPSAPGKVAIGGGGYGFGCKDPDGRNLAFVCESRRSRRRRGQAGPAAQDRACRSQRARLRPKP